MSPLTPRQQQVLDVIWGYVQGHGYPPSVREIGAAMGLRSSATVQRHLEALERAGYIVWERGRARTIQIRLPAQAGKEANDHGVVLV